MADEKEIQRLIQDLGSDEWDVKWDAAIHLGALAEKGVDCSVAIPALIDALKDINTGMRWQAAFVLGIIGDVRAVPVLIEAMKDEDSGVRGSSAWALGEMGDVRAVPALIDTLKDDDKDVRYAATRALDRIAKKGGDCSAAVPYLLDALKDEDEDVRKGAAFSIDKILEKSIEEENYPTALKTIKLFTNNIIKNYEGKKDRDSLKERRKELARFESLAQQIHDKMKTDKKFHKPVKHQPVRAVRKKVIANG